MNKKFLTPWIFVLATLFFVLPQFSCDKDHSDDNIPNPKSIEGLWVGTYDVDGRPEFGKQYFSFVIKPDGTLINDTKGANQQHLGIGNWTLTGESFTANAVCVYGLSINLGIEETFTGTFNKTTGTWTNCIWKNKAPLTGSGTFTLKKVE